MELLTVEKVSDMYAIMQIGYNEDTEEALEQIQWLRDSVADDHNIVLLAREEITQIGQSVTKQTFLHGRNIGAKNGNYTYKTTSNQQDCPLFSVLLIDACAIRTTVIINNQYSSYSKTFNLPHSITLSKNRTIARIGGTRTSPGLATIQIAFNCYEL